MRSKQLVKGLACFGLLLSLAASAHAETDLHLLGERFRVTATWRTPDGASGEAQAKPLTGETGLFWFFSESNTELVVKILAACAPPFEHYWIYAAGLTDVEVKLTVLDTLSGQAKVYRRPAGTLFAPLADTSTFRCGAMASCGQGTIEQIAATPRPNEEAEQLALLLGPGITADPAIYARLVDDLAQIWITDPAMAGLGFVPFWEANSLIIDLTTGAYQQLKGGEYEEWSCLNGWYRGEVERVSVSFPSAVLRFDGRLHPVRIASDYEALPGVLVVSPNLLRNYPGGNGPPHGLCTRIDGTAYDYFFDDFGRGLSWYFRIPQAGAAPVAVGQVGSQAPRPDWWPLRTQCLDEQKAASNH